MAAGALDNNTKSGLIRHLTGIIKILRNYQVFLTVNIHLHPKQASDDFDDSGVRWYIEQR